MLSLSQPAEKGRDGLRLRRRVVMGYNALGRKAINVVLVAACGGGS